MSCPISMPACPFKEAVAEIPPKSLSCELKSKLSKVAAELCVPNKGLLAADESTGTIGKRFAQIGVENTAETRSAYRQIIFDAVDELSKHISGIILYDETFRQKFPNGTAFIKAATSAGIKVGIKVDKGLATHVANETYTVGLDDLDARLKEYAADGAHFTKWRAALRIGASGVNETTLQHNAVGLAQYALASQKSGLVPVVEPEILSDGPHSLSEAMAASERVLSAVFCELVRAGVFLEGMVLKPSMVVPGTMHGKAVSADTVARATLLAMQRTVPAAVPGVFFLSGGLSEEDATKYLAAIATLPGKKPWTLSFSFGRALQQSALKTWEGKPANAAAAKAKLVERAKANGEAAKNRCPFAEAAMFVACTPDATKTAHGMGTYGGTTTCQPNMAGKTSCCPAK